jgi:DNA-binding PadR family transcriptional regulator
MRKLIRLVAEDGGSAIKSEPRAELLPFISQKEALILQLLVARGETYGLALVDASEGALKRGTVYVTLDRMEDKGLIESKKAPHTPGEGPSKRMYKATGYGARVLQAWELVGLNSAREMGR